MTIVVVRANVHVNNKNSAWTEHNNCRLKNIKVLIQEQMIEQMKMWNPEYADEMRAEMADQPPPPWRDLDIDVIRRHIGPAAWDVRVNDDGFVANFSLLEAE